MKLKSVTGLEILDSRGRPTLQATVELAEGARGTASVPAGASTGKAEARELRDGEPKRYQGLGCRKAVAKLEEIGLSLKGQSFDDQAGLDRKLDASKMGANTVLAVSMAFARASAAERGVPLYRYLARTPPRALPRPTINLFSGGKHAGGQVPIQDVLVVPQARTMDEALAETFDVYQSAAELISKKYGMRALAADEGGLAPAFPDSEAMLKDAVEAAGKGMNLAIDVASSHFFRDGRYQFEGKALTGEGMIERLMQWLDRYPIMSLEDGLAEEDWEHWPDLCARASNRALVMGDDLLCTNPARIRRAIESRSANALLLKVNQIGTLTQAAEAYALARSAGWKVTFSARSGETEDDWLADLAVGWGGDFIKIGSITRSERLSKYNRLLAIASETGLSLANEKFDQG